MTEKCLRKDECANKRILLFELIRTVRRKMKNENNEQKLIRMVCL